MAGKALQGSHTGRSSGQVSESMRQLAHISANWEAKVSGRKSDQAISYPDPLIHFLQPGSIS